MANFTFQPTTGDLAEIKSSAFGTSGLAAARFTASDQGKSIKLGAADTMVLTATGNEIEGFVTSVENQTVNDGYSFGGYQSEGRVKVWLEEAITLGAYVVAGAQVTLNTALPNTYPNVKNGSPTKYIWRLVSGSGLINTVGVIERV